MNAHRKLVTLACQSLVVSLLLVVSMACGTATPSGSPSPASSVSSPISSPASSASASASPSSKPASAEEQAYQKAQADWPKVVAAAQKEGEAVLYAVSDPASLQKWQDGFNKLDPKIQIKLVRQQVQAAERLHAEQDTKQYLSNGYWGGSGQARVLARDGLGQVINDLPVMFEPGVKWIAPPNFDKPHETVTVGFTQYFIMVNTNVVPAGQEPKTWKDMADPKWKDRVALWEPRIASIGRAVLAAMYINAQDGPDTVRKVVENMRVWSDGTDVARAVARGELAVGVGTYTSYQAVKDGPVKLYVPEDGAMFSPMQVVVVKNAPQINTVKVFLDWLLGKDGQQLLSDGIGVVRPDVNPVVKEMQVAPGAKYYPNSPFNWDFEMSKTAEPAKTFGKWLDDLGK